MPCHTAHIWINELKKAVTIPFYSIIENTVQIMLKQKSTQNKKVLLLATETLINSRLYQTEFENSSVELIIPTTEEQKLVDNAIRYVKVSKFTTNQYIQDLNQVLKHYSNKGISALMGCCTEVPLMFPYFSVDMKMIDPTLMLAKMAIKMAL